MGSHVPHSVLGKCAPCAWESTMRILHAVGYLVRRHLGRSIGYDMVAFWSSAAASTISINVNVFSQIEWRTLAQVELDELLKSKGPPQKISFK